MKSSKYISKQPDKNGNIPYTEEENQVWKTLYQRQEKVLPGRSCSEFIEGLHKLDLAKDRIPQPYEVDKNLKAATGWGVETVAAVIPPDEFFTLLANKRFPAASFIRDKDELDYLKEPDIFHELFGHCPLLTLQPYADFVEEYGKLALAATPEQQKYLFRLFWFTIEFSLIQSPEGVRIMGGGILSSYQETLSALIDENTGREVFDVDRVLRTPYRIDKIQPHYFILEGFHQLYSILELDLLKKIDEIKELPDVPVQSQAI